jgi:gluconolactonase
VSSLDTLKDLLDKQHDTFDKFKQANDERLKQLEQRGSADAVTVEKVEKLSAELDRLADNLPSPNGLALNAAQDILYVAVTRANAVWRLPLLAPTARNPAGGVARMGKFIQLSGGRGPDGMAIDAEDGLAVAHPDMGAVWLFDRRGEPVLRIDSPQSTVVTNVAHGGPGLRTLYIVDSEAGCILAAPVPVAGRMLPSHR